MKGWKYTRRKVNGTRRRVKVRKTSRGKYQVRLVGHRNRHD